MTAHQKPFSILFVDDDPDDHFFLKLAFKQIDPSIQFISVYNGKQALDYLLYKGAFKDHKHTNPDLIITDVNMPLVNGFEFMSAKRESYLLKDIPLFVLSTGTEQCTSTKSLEFGAIKCYNKPVDTGDMVAIAEDVLIRASA